VLRANAIHDCSNEGVLILGASEPWISHNDIRRNKGAGIAARDGARPAMVGNVFEKNAVEVPEDMRQTVLERNIFWTWERLLRKPPHGKRGMIASASRKLGKYEILRKLGRGGMADVYLARTPNPARPWH